MQDTFFFKNPIEFLIFPVGKLILHAIYYFPMGYQFLKLNISWHWHNYSAQSLKLTLNLVLRKPHAIYC